MKAITLLILLSVFVSQAQQPPEKPSDLSDPSAGRVELRSRNRAPAEQADKSKKASGVIAQAIRVRNPLKLIDPRAPRELGNGHENVSRDPITGRAEGIRLLAIRF